MSIDFACADEADTRAVAKATTANTDRLGIISPPRPLGRIYRPRVGGAT
jgi:hypothetical protein